jgi:transposase, IS30 family
VLVAVRAAREWSVLSTAELRECGLSDKAVAVRVANGRLHPLFRGVHAVGHANPPLEGRFLAAVKACGPSAVLSHFSAAALMGLVRWDGRFPEVTVVGSTTRTHRGLRVHRTLRLEPPDVALHQGIPITAPARTLADLASQLDRRSLRRAVRQAQSLGLVEIGQLVEILGRLGPRRGTRNLGRIVATGPAPTRSELEDAVLDLILRGGLAHPEVNAELVLDGRQVIPDFRWPAQRLVIEADSRTWHENKLSREDDAERQALLEAHGERVLRVTWKQAITQPGPTLARIRAAGAPPSAECRVAPSEGRWAPPVVATDWLGCDERGEIWVAKGASYRWLTPPERREVAARLEGGEERERVARAMCCSVRTIERIWVESRVRSRRVGQSRQRLQFEDRERISRGLAADESARSIARDLSRSASTITREIDRCGGRKRYRALAAHRRAIRLAERPKRGKLARSPRLREEVERGLLRRWSPQQISAKLRLDHPDDEEMRVSHETIYQALYIQSRGELRRQLTENLRSKRTRRRPRGSGLGVRGRIKGMVPISERPPEVADRAVPGHWEGDLLVGAYGRSFIATLVERQTRYVLLAYLGNDGTTEHVIEALKQRIRDLPRHLLLSLTWDQGKELAAHARLSKEHGIEVYFCDPHSPWQRGSNENTNGLLRQYLPKSSDLAARSQVELDEIAAELNGRPRQTLGWMTPAEKMEQLLR